MAYPVKLGRRPEAPVIYSACFELLKKGQISDRSTHAVVRNAVKKSLEERNREDPEFISPTGDTIRVHVIDWTEQVKELAAKGDPPEVIRRKLLSHQKGRPYDPWGPWKIRRRKKR